MKAAVEKSGRIFALETNFLWQSILDHDYSTRTVERYRDFLGRQRSEPPPRDVRVPPAPGEDEAGTLCHL